MKTYIYSIEKIERITAVSQDDAENQLRNLGYDPGEMTLEDITEDA